MLKSRLNERKTEMIVLSGAEIKSLMRKHRKSIAGLAAAMNVSQVRVRYVRANGVKGALFVQDWLEAIQG